MREGGRWLRHRASRHAADTLRAALPSGGSWARRVVVAAAADRPPALSLPPQPRPRAASSAASPDAPPSTARRPRWCARAATARWRPPALLALLYFALSLAVFTNSLSHPPPSSNNTKQVWVSYAPADVDAFIAAADAVEEAFPGVLVEGEEAEEGAGGEGASSASAFEVRLADGERVFARAAGVVAAADEPAAVVAALRGAGARPAGGAP